MGNIKNQLSKLEGIGQLTSFEQVSEEWILTPEEESAAIANAIEQEKRFYEVKYLRKGVPKPMVDERIAEMKFEELIPANEILKKANSSKHYKIWEQEQRDKEKQEAIERLETLRKTWTALMILKLMRHTSKEVYGKTLIENIHTLPLIKAVCFFLSQDERFETELKFSFNKGLLIRGVAGVGKTHIVKCAQSNELNPVTICSMIEISDEIRVQGQFIPPPFKKLYLDDVGSEEATINHFGSKINWFKDFIETWYLRGQGFNRLIVSTNCSASEIENKYGFRVRDRVKDMFNLIDVEGESMRGL
jgi:hypothetical protein